MLTLTTLLAALPPLEAHPDSLLPAAQRERLWHMEVRDYVRHPGLLRNAITWREEELADPGPKTDPTQLQAALHRLRALARLLSTPAPVNHA
jgi:hypothetical protein